MAHVQTVLGPVAPDAIGRILQHEHLLSLTPGPWMSGGCHVPARSGAIPIERQDAIDCAVRALAGLAEQGVDTIVDLSPYGVVGRDDHGENVEWLADISRITGIHIVSGTAVYLESFSPAWTVAADLDTMAARLLADVTTGLGSTGIRAGVLGEQATGLDVITAHEEKCLRAAARVSRETGLSVNTHTTHGTMALEQIAILREEGVDLPRVVIGHMDTRPDTDYVRQVLDTGVNIAFDTIGKQYWDFRVAPLPADQADGPFTKDAYLRSDRTRLERLVTLLAEGYVEQILLAQDLTGSEVYLNPETHGQWGYAYLAGPFADELDVAGVSPQQLETMLRRNPLRLLTLES